MSHARIVLWALGLVGIWGAGAASAATLYMGSDQGYTTIQSAIDGANQGDTVVVGEGTYTENLDFKGKAITVKSTGPLQPKVVAATIINGNKAGSVVTFQSGETAKSVLNGFTLTNGSGTADQNGHTHGGGVYCANNSSPTLTNNIISRNQADLGAGVYCYESSPALTHNTIRGNGSSVTSGGGVECDWSTPTLTNNTISRNSATDGGGVNCSGCSPTLTNNTLSGNSATDGGGLYCWYASPTLTNNTISGNSASGGGGGVWCDVSSPTLTNDTIGGNSGGSGGGVECYDNSSPIIKNTIIALNTKGGGLRVYDPTSSRPVVTYCDVYGNAGGNYVNWPNQTGKNGNISANPLFVNAPARNFHLKSGSPCLTAGAGGVQMGAYGGAVPASGAATSSVAALTVSAAAVSISGGSAQIVVTLASAASVEAVIVNIAGREVAVLPAQNLAAGVSTMLWDGRSALGTKAPAGQYLVRVTARTQDGGQAQALVALELRR